LEDEGGARGAGVRAAGGALGDRDEVVHLPAQPRGASGCAQAAWVLLLSRTGAAVVCEPAAHGAAAEGRAEPRGEAEPGIPLVVSSDGSGVPQGRDAERTGADLRVRGGTAERGQAASEDDA